MSLGQKGTVLPVFNGLFLIAIPSQNQQGHTAKRKKEKSHLKCFNDSLFNILQLLGISQAWSFINKIVMAYFYYAMTHEICICGELGTQLFLWVFQCCLLGQLKQRDFFSHKTFSLPLLIPSVSLTSPLHNLITIVNHSKLMSMLGS